MSSSLKVEKKFSICRSSARSGVGMTSCGVGLGLGVSENSNNYL